MSTTATYQVDGMTCGHCAKSVTEEITALDGVRDVQVELVAGRLRPDPAALAPVTSRA